MKKIILLSGLIIGALGLQAQNWAQGKIALFNATIGGTQGIYVGSAYGFGSYSALSTLGMAIHHSGEFAVHDFIGVGYQTGLNLWFSSFGGTAVGIPIMAKANFHILDAIKTSAPDQLDVYAGLSFGGAPVFFGNGGGTLGMIHVGPQLGARYWFLDKVGVQLEAGWGAQFIAAGVTF